MLLTTLTQLAAEKQEASHTFSSEILRDVIIWLHWWVDTKENSWSGWMAINTSDTITMSLCKKDVTPVRLQFVLRLAEITACSFTAPSHYLSQCWFITKGSVAFTWNQFHQKCSWISILFSEIALLKLSPHRPGTSEIIALYAYSRLFTCSLFSIGLSYFIRENHNSNKFTFSVVCVSSKRSYLCTHFQLVANHYIFW